MTHPAQNPIGWEWVARYPAIYKGAGVAWLTERDACQVCGHPTADCTEETHLMAESKAKQGPAENKARAAKTPEDALTAAREAALSPNQAGHPTAEAAAAYARSLLPEEQEVVVVKEDVYETFRHPGSDRDSERLKYHAGQRIPKATADEEGVATTRQ